MTENPFSTQGWNRYSYTGNSPVNFTDPSGYCFMGCFWQPVFKAIGNFFRQSWRALVQLGAATLLCAGAGPAAPICAGVVAFAVTGVTSGDLGLAMRAGITAFATAFAFKVVGDITGEFPGAPNGGHAPLIPGSEAHMFNIAGHALVGCASSVAQGSRCGPGALSGAIGSLVGPYMRDQSFGFRVVANAVLGGIVSVAGGGNFGTGALTAAFGYLFNEVALACRGVMNNPAVHCGLFVYKIHEFDNSIQIIAQFSFSGWSERFNENNFLGTCETCRYDLESFKEQIWTGKGFYVIEPPKGMAPHTFEDWIIHWAQSYQTNWETYVPGYHDSNSAACYPIIKSGAKLPDVPYAPGLKYYEGK